MTPEEDAAIRKAIIEKKIDIGVTRVAIEDMEVNVGLVAKRQMLATQLDALEELYRSLRNEP